MNKERKNKVVVRFSKKDDNTFPIPLAWGKYPIQVTQRFSLLFP